MYIPIGAAKIVLFLHIRKKKVQFVVKPALFYLEVGPLRCWRLEVGRFIYHLFIYAAGTSSSIIYKSPIYNLK